ncbi:exported hypothetical protein [Agrobacterium genomosp. 5 str. CFBP 6626]|nr:exported hypothetical protein [Agrobacterium genomosp. 5 str. CFBP 6626]
MRAALAACAACCAVSIVPAFLAGTCLVALGAGAATWGLPALLIAMPLAGAYFWARRSAGPDKGFKVLMAADGCGCGSTCATPAARSHRWQFWPPPERRRGTRSPH